MLGAMRVWLKRIALTTLAALLLVAAAYWVPSAVTMDREAYAVMSAYLAGGLTGESHDLGSVNALIVIYGHTTNGLFRILLPPQLSSESLMMRAEAVIRGMSSQPLQRKFTLHAPYIFTNDASTLQTDLTEVQRRAGYGTITFSKVIFNHDATRAVFYTEHLCGLCGEGKFVAMEKRDGKWIVVDEKYTWVS